MAYDTFNIHSGGTTTYRKCDTDQIIPAFLESNKREAFGDNL
jgi:3-isopropylmalate dehydratase small subunit